MDVSEAQHLITVRRNEQGVDSDEHKAQIGGVDIELASQDYQFKVFPHGKLFYYHHR